MSDLLEPKRLETLDRIMSLYGKYLEPDDKIRIGVEGDPCSRYRSVEESPCGTVQQILERREDGFLRFRAVLDSGDTCEFTNRSFDPEFVWELHPDSVENFSKRVNGFRGTYSHDSAPNPKVGELEEKVKQMEEKIAMVTKDMSERLSTLEEAQHTFRGKETGEELDGLKESEKVFRETMASTIRALAGDTLRVARGEPVEFVHQYVDRYDMALEDRAASSYRGSSSSPKRKSSMNQEEKYSFDEFKRGDTASIRECTELTDD